MGATSWRSETIQGDDLSLCLERDGRRVRFLPQFVGTLPNGRMAYFDRIDSPGIGFVGWYPYEIQAWPISRSKLQFKQTCHQIGLDTPEHWTELAEVTAPFDRAIHREGRQFGFWRRSRWAVSSRRADGGRCAA